MARFDFLAPLLLISIFLVFLDPLSPHFSSISALKFNNRNDCHIFRQEFGMAMYKDYIDTTQLLVIHMATNGVGECFFSAENFNITRVEVQDQQHKTIPMISTQFMENYIIVRLLGSKFEANKFYYVKFYATKRLEAANDGMVFRYYRDPATLLEDWYAIVLVEPTLCGKVFICVNSLNDRIGMTYRIMHSPLLNLFCSGDTETIPMPGYNYEVCKQSADDPVGPNSLHFVLGNFYAKETVLGPYRVRLVFPLGPDLKPYEYLDNYLYFIDNMLREIDKHVPMKQFFVNIFVLPNFKRDPVIQLGSCYLSIDPFLNNLDIEKTHATIARCLIYQGMITARRSEAWSLKWVLEGMFELYWSTFSLGDVLQANTYYRDCLEGDDDELASLAQIYSDLTQTRAKRPFRKAAGLFAMLKSINPEYANQTYVDFTLHWDTATTSNEFVDWITKKSDLVFLNKADFMDMIYGFTATTGYPIMKATVTSNNVSICVEHWNHGKEYFKSYWLPFQVTYDFPHNKDSNFMWTRPLLENCMPIPDPIYPYLINAHIDMVVRYLYDDTNWKEWTQNLLHQEFRDAITTKQKVILVTDAFFFARQGEISYLEALKFLHIIRFETDLWAWDQYDSTITHLEAIARYTSIYAIFRVTVGDLIERFYNASIPNNLNAPVAIKWACFAANPLCLERSKDYVMEVIKDHTTFPDTRETLCAGMRYLDPKIYVKLIESIGKPDWREPEFYVDLLLCAENKKVMRNLLHHLFFHNTWQFRPNILRDMVLKMIRMSKTGSDAVFLYLDHDPEGLLMQLNLKNLFIIVDELATYQHNNFWFQRLVSRLKLKRYMDEPAYDHYKLIMEKLKKNKRWYNNHYVKFQKFLIIGFPKIIQQIT